MTNDSTYQSTATAHGATISTAYVGRNVKVFAVTEQELESISRLNTLANVFLSVAASLVSISIGIWTNAAFITTPTPESSVLTKFVAPCLAALSIVFGVLGYWAMQARKNSITRIREESGLSPAANPKA